MATLPCSFVLGLPAGAVSSLAPSKMYLAFFLGVSVAGGIGYSTALYYCRASPSGKLSLVLGVSFGAVVVGSIALGLCSSLNFGPLFLSSFVGSIGIGVVAAWVNRRRIHSIR